MKHPFTANYTQFLSCFGRHVYALAILKAKNPNSRWNRERLKTFQDMLRQKCSEP